MHMYSEKRHRLRIIIPAFPTFNIYSHVAQRTTALGPVCVATAAHELEGWDVEIIDENNFSRYGPRENSGATDHRLLQEQRPADVVGLYGGLTSTIPRLYQIANFYHQQGVVTVAGGQHFVPDTIPEGLASGIDYIALGEGEQTIKEFLEALEKKQELDGIKGLAYRKNGKVFYTPSRSPRNDFDVLPQPDFSLLRYAKMKLYPVERIRGCGMDCEFCTVKGKPRCASPERLLESMRLLVETKDARHFFIVDDLFGQQRDETIRFCSMLRQYQKDINLRLDTTVQIRLDKANDKELLSHMRRAGINTVAIGFESPIDEELLAMKKHIRSKDMIALAHVYRRFGFLIHGMFIFGYPLKENHLNMPMRERVKRYKAFIRNAKIDTIQVLLPVPLPGTELHKRLKEQNRIFSTGDIGWQYYDGNFPLFEPDPPMTPLDMQRCVHLIMGKFYQFKHAFELILHVFSFPTLLFYCYNMRAGWRIWYRGWRNSFTRFGGWIIMKGWKKEFKKGNFTEQLRRAQVHLSKKS